MKNCKACDKLFEERKMKVYAVMNVEKIKDVKWFKIILRKKLKKSSICQA